jgi:hypothetical protein
MTDVNDRNRSSKDRAETPWLAIAFVMLGILSGMALYIMEQDGTRARTAQSTPPAQQTR